MPLRRSGGRIPDAMAKPTLLPDPCTVYLVHPIKKGTLRSDLSRRKGERMSSWEECVSWTRDAVFERESAPELVCQVLESERASAKCGTEGVGSAIEGQSLLPSELGYRRGPSVIERSNPRSTREACWEGG